MRTDSVQVRVRRGLRAERRSVYLNSTATRPWDNQKSIKRLFRRRSCRGIFLFELIESVLYRDLYRGGVPNVDSVLQIGAP